MQDQYLHETASSLKNNYDLEIIGVISEEAIILALEQKVAQLLALSTEAFLQKMYTLDIAEQKLKQSFESENPNAAIARLIFDRQMQKARARKMYKNKEADDETLRW